LFLDKFAEFVGSGVKTTRIIKVFLCAVPNRLNVVLSVLYQQKALERRNQSSPVFSWHAIPWWVPRCRAVRKANTATKWAGIKGKPPEIRQRCISFVVCRAATLEANLKAAAGTALCPRLLSVLESITFF
jgi:hypothetical protein